MHRSQRPSLAVLAVFLSLAGCRSVAPAPESAPPTPPPLTATTASLPPPDQSGPLVSVVITRDGDVCRYERRNESCPPGLHCRPSPPLVIDCPPELLDGGAPEGPTARPPGREAWYRVREALAVQWHACVFEEPYYCPPDGARGICTDLHGVRIHCERHVPPGGHALAPGEPRLRTGTVPSPPPGREGQVFVRSFVYESAPGQCVRVPDFWCPPPAGLCPVPPGVPAPCSEREPVR
jgi:hypothetical protein